MDQPPEFSLPASDDRTWTTKDLVSERTVLYFYPKDDTPGCTTESCDFRDNLARIQAAGVRVVGVSPDSVASHKKFIAKHGLTFPLLADVDHALAEAMGVWVEKSMYGRTYMGIERSTFLIAKGGAITRTWNKVKVSGHVDEVLAAINAS